MTTGVTPIEYKWKDGSQIQVDATAARVEFDRIAKERGAVSADAVVDASRPDEAPLHPHFEWDDSAAAEEYRKEQARHLMRSLIVVYVRNDTEEEQPPIRAMVKLEPLIKAREKQPAPSGYTPIKEVMSNDELHLHMIRQAIQSLNVWAARYGDMPEFAQVKRLAERLALVHGLAG